MHLRCMTSLSSCTSTTWQESYIVSLNKGKGVVLNRGNYSMDLKVIEQVIKVFEHVVGV